MKPKKLPLSFYKRDTQTVARELLGKRLVHIVRGQRISGLIVETEAYIGADDRACHGFGHRRTPRTESLYQDGGFSYVFLVYGLHHCFNVVTRGKNDPEAVLIRALQPCEGIELMRSFRRVKKDLDLTNGPGKLADALQINKKLDRHSLVSSDLFIERMSDEKPKITATPRIGVDYAGEAAKWPLRFLIKDNAYVSGKPQVAKSATSRENFCTEKF